MRHPLRRSKLRLRILPLVAAGAVLLWLCQPTLGSLAVGAAVIALGEALRVWGAGHLVKNDRLTTSGPYAHVRNPLYAGSFLVGVGFAIAAGGGWIAWSILAALLVFFFVHYFPRKERIESARLERFHGAPYAAYRRAVPAFVPSLSAWRPHRIESAAHDIAEQTWSRRRFHDNNEFGTLLGVVLGLAALGTRLLLAA